MKPMKKFGNGSIHLTDEDYDKVEINNECDKPEPAPRESDYDRLKRNHYF
jgi:hypothetical protein